MFFVLLVFVFFRFTLQVLALIRRPDTKKVTKKREKIFSEKNAAAYRIPCHIPIILNFSGKVNGKRARSIGKFNRGVLLRTIASTRRFRRHKKFPGFRREKTPVQKLVFMRLKRIAECRLPYRRGNLSRRRARLRTERSLIIAYIVNEYPPENSFPEGVFLCRKQKTKLIFQSQAALSPSYRNRKISYFLYSRSNLQR